jgi:hypothetical protein
LVEHIAICYLEEKRKEKEDKNSILFATLPNVTNPALANNASAGAPFTSGGGEGDHKQEGALLSPAVRLASTNS